MWKCKKIGSFLYLILETHKPGIQIQYTPYTTKSQDRISQSINIFFLAP